MPTKVILDTDIGSDIDDAVCLAYLLANPAVDLLGITTVSGEPERRAMMASAQCKVAGKAVPIYPGIEHPLVIDIVQAHCPQADALGNWAHDTSFPKNDAVEFLRRTIRANPGEVTLLAIGPLTNLAVLFTEDPEIPSLLKSLVLMNGWFLPTQPGAEWNVKCDPHASAIVYKARPPQFRAIGLDVTLQVQMEAAEVRQRFDTPLLRPVLDFAEVWFKMRPEITFHDPLAAAVIFDDGICSFQRGSVEVNLNAGQELAVTHWKPSDAGQVEIAATVDAQRFFDHYFSFFA